ncbi:MAG TPA: STAS domain-containing protein [Tepidisphaeraceae bacterium]|jgi:anti-anti-sigma regulatory factor
MLATHPKLHVRPAHVKLMPRGRCFSHAEACHLSGQALRHDGKRVVIDLASVEDATTSAFAQLVLLRRSLLRIGRDLCLTGLRDRTAGLFQVNRLELVLPIA